MAQKIIGVMGPARATEHDLKTAEALGRLIAENEWVLLSGGRIEGVMGAVNKGAKAAGGLTVGVLPTADKEGISPHVDVPIITGMGSARNNINVLSSDVVVAYGMGAGTTSEVVLAAKAGKPVLLLNHTKEALNFFQSLGLAVIAVATAEAAIVAIKQY